MTHASDFSIETVATTATCHQPLSHLIDFGETTNDVSKDESRSRRHDVEGQNPLQLFGIRYPWRKASKSKKSFSTPAVVNLIVEEQWEMLSSYLPRELMQVVQTQYRQHLPETPNIGSWNALHFACAFNAPASIIINFAQSYKEGLREIDERGRTPLHIATAFGASPAIIRILLAEFPYAASVADTEGRYALHLACQKRKVTSKNALQSNRNDQGCWGWTCASAGDGSNEYDECFDLFDDDEEDEDDAYGEPLDTLFCSGAHEDFFFRQRVMERYNYDGPSVETIKALCDASPLTIREEDHAGYNALEYAINSSLRESVILELQEATSQSNKKKMQV